ncbi:hypothetical protein LEN26_005439 [Aphanomyces euteiches]|nr:hypothetical protein LEN26_005439 [Aphanomyces euteiches]
MSQQSDNKSTFDSLKDAVTSSIDAAKSTLDNMKSKLHASDKSTDPYRPTEETHDVQVYTTAPAGSDTSELPTGTARPSSDQSIPMYGSTCHDAVKTSHDEDMSAMEKLKSKLHSGVDSAKESLSNVKHKISDFGHNVKEKTSDSMHSMKEGTKESLQHMKESASDTGAKVKDKTSDTMHSMKEGTKESADNVRSNDDGTHRNLCDR